MHVVAAAPQPFTEQGREKTGALAKTLFHVARGAVMGPFMNDEDAATIKALGNHYLNRQRAERPSDRTEADGGWYDVQTGAKVQ